MIIAIKVPFLYKSEAAHTMRLCGNAIREHLAPFSKKRAERSEARREFAVGLPHPIPICQAVKQTLFANISPRSPKNERNEVKRDANLPWGFPTRFLFVRL